MIPEEALNFLYENRLHNSKEWFSEHKSAYTQLIRKPLYRFVEEMTPFFLHADPQIVLMPQRIISRINRDTRFSKDKALFRDTILCNFTRDKRTYPGYPSFFLEFSPAGYRYGCGYLVTPPGLMDGVRELVTAWDPDFLKARQAAESQRLFTMQGDIYLRDHFPDQPKELAPWINRKSIYFARSIRQSRDLLSHRFTPSLARDYEYLIPIYHFFCKASERYRIQRMEPIHDALE